MERNEISLHQVKIWKAVTNHDGWITAKDVAEKAGVARRTASLHCLNLVKLGIFDLAEVFPAHMYRASEMGDKRNKAYLLRLEKAANVFGLEE